MNKAWPICLEAPEIPRRVPGVTEEGPAHVVVDPMHLVPAGGVMRDGRGADQPATARYENAPHHVRRSRRARRRSTWATVTAWSIERARFPQNHPSQRSFARA